MNKVERMKELINILEPAARAYYAEGREIMSNYEYDKMYDELLELEKATGIVLGGSPTQKVGYEPISGFEKEVHASPMLSLDKTKEVEELKEKTGDKVCWLSWKLDGMTIVLTYENGELIKAVTRGDGLRGDIITQNAKYFKNVPLKIKEKNRKVIRGEAVISYKTFERINKELEGKRDSYENPRNLCAGTIRNLQPKIVADRCVQFIPFTYVEGSNSNSHFERMSELADMGFVPVQGYLVKQNEIEETVEKFREAVKTYEFPSDGLVLTFDDIAYGESLGTTSKFPRSGLAFKWADEAAETTLREIEWSVSKTGLINPVAIFDPVELEGTTVRRASLHNISIIRQLQLGIGDKIEVIKANMIIPQVINNLTKSNTAAIPSVCPVCGADTHINVDQNSGCQTLYCTGDDCYSRRYTEIGHYCSRDALDIVGISEKTVGTLIANGFISTIADLYRLEEKKEKIINLNGFGKKSYDKMMESIQKSMETEMYRVLYGINIPDFGVSNCKRVCKQYPNLQTLEDLQALTEEELLAIEGIGDVMSKSFVEFFKNEKNAALVSEILSFLTIRKPQVSEENSAVTGKTFVITGSLNRCSRNELKELIEQKGGKVSGSVSAKTTCLINNDIESKSGKNKTAKELGVRIICEEDFYEEYLK